MRSPRVALTSLVCLVGWFVVGLAACGLAACGDNAERGAPGTELQSVSITPAAPTLAAGTTAQLSATGTFSDATTSDVSGTATWTSSDKAIATVSSTGVVAAIAPGTATITATSSGVSGTATVTVTAATLETIEVTPPDQQLPAGITSQLTAMGMFSDGSTQNVTGQVTWASSDTDKVTVSASGVAKAIAVGSATITASMGSVSGMTTITTTAALLVSIEITPNPASVQIGGTLQLTATGTFSDDTQRALTTVDGLSWSSGTTDTATIDATGLLTANAVGTVTIRASVITADGTRSGTLDVNVTLELISIEVTPPDLSLAKGLSQQYVAKGTFSDGSIQTITDQVAWSSTVDTVAQISNAAGSRGKATAAAVGNTQIQASLDGKTGEAHLEVTPPIIVSIAVTPGTASVPNGRTQQYTATATLSDTTEDDVTATVTWGSTDETVATISNAVDKGLATVKGTGTTQITATLGVTGSASLIGIDPVLDSIVVTPSTALVSPGETTAYTATGTFSDGHTENRTANATWASSNVAVATVSDDPATKGVATGVAVGTTQITATDGAVSSAAKIVVVVRPIVTATFPRDGALGLRVSAPVQLTFSEAIDPSTLTTQTADGPCTGSLQLSADDFATCVAFSGAPTMNAANTVATATPAALLAQTTYRVRVLDTVTNVAGTPLAPVTQATGFATAAAGTCATGVVISQVYGGGGNAGAQFRNDFIELHNAGSTPFNLTGYAVQFTSAAGTTWSSQSLPAVVVPPGGYFLIQESAGTTNPPPPLLPTPDLIPASAFLMGAASGKVALTPSTTALTGACPLEFTIDLVGYGVGSTPPPSCTEGTGVATMSNTTAAQRKSEGCTDANANSADFTVAAPAPRNGATAPSVCACFAGIASEVDATDVSLLGEAEVSSAVRGSGIRAPAPARR